MRCRLNGTFEQQFEFYTMGQVFCKQVRGGIRPPLKNESGLIRIYQA
jgi:hypothetical protein